MRGWLAFGAVVLGIVGLVSCAGAPASFQSPIPTMTAAPEPNAIMPRPEVVVGSLRARGLPITADTVYTSEDDPNHLLGRPHQYIGKAAWRDARVDWPDPLGVDTGGTVEVFTTLEDLETRRKYVDALSRSTIFAQYQYAKGLALVRLSPKLTPAQAAEYEQAIQQLP
jgi:hypothetical protein